MNARRHAPVGRYRAPRLKNRASGGLNHVKQGRGRHLGADIYARDRAGSGNAAAVRWIVSTLIAATISLMVTAVVVYGSLDPQDDQPIDILAELEAAATSPSLVPASHRPVSLDWLSPKQDKLQLATTTLITRHVIHEQIRVRRNNRPFLQIKPYLRIRARLAPASRDFNDLIPAFDPVRLYAPTPSSGDHSRRRDTPGHGSVATEIVNLSNGILPPGDRQVLQPFEVAQLVAEAMESDPGAPAVRIGIEQQLIEGLTPGYLTVAPFLDVERTQDPINLTTIVRTIDPMAIEVTDRDERVVHVLSPSDGDTISELLARLNTRPGLARQIEAAAAQVLGAPSLRTGQQVLVVLRSLTGGEGDVEPVKLNVFDVGQVHRVSVQVSQAGRIVASPDPDQRALLLAMNNVNDARNRGAELYESIYALGLAQGLPPAEILKLIKIHAPDTDYRGQIRAGDTLEAFFELEPDERGELQPTTLVYTALTTSGETRRYWRFRSQDGAVDYFNENGENNRKFLLRKPVRGTNVRLTSGFGMRMHPILRQRRMHAGVDWAAPTGTPIVAAGNGVVTQVQRLRFYGNFIRVRHANGYETAYAHLHRFAPGLRKGQRVRQGEVIGQVGNTGRSTGPHLHFEVRINSRVVDPLKIHVPRARILKDRELAEFQKERTRILTVMRFPPVRVAERQTQ